MTSFVELYDEYLVNDPTVRNHYYAFLLRDQLIIDQKVEAYAQESFDFMNQKRYEAEQEILTARHSKLITYFNNFNNFNPTCLQDLYRPLEICHYNVLGW